MEYRNKPELLAPAGSFEALKTAVLYGADSVYLGGQRYGLRAKARNFGEDELKEAVRYAHERGVRVHVTVNIVAHDADFEGLEEYLKYLRALGVDALIVSDAGVIDLAKTCVPDMELHLSTQASATNYRTMNFWGRHGVKRVVAARELSLTELRAVREHLDPGLELETFVHGAMCVSVSGRCLLSNYLTGRDANAGACVHPCRWKYRLVEESRPGEYYPIAEDENGAYILNATDLCMIEHIPELCDAGIGSFKIEGRMKTPLYVAMVTKIYREAIDDYFTDPALYRSKTAYYLEQLSMISHRGYNTGFYFGHPGADAHMYDSGDCIRSMSFVGKVLADGWVEQRGRFATGDTLYLLVPHSPDAAFTVGVIRRESGEEVNSAPHAKERIKINLPAEAGEGMILMRKTDADSRPT